LSQQLHSLESVASGRVLWLTYSGAIHPVTQEIFVRAIEQAELGEYECLVIELDTPGGLETSMRAIIKRMMVAELPVVVYISPSGSQSASAGAIITLASHVAAMAPGTNIGAAHPVNVGGGSTDETMQEKMENDAAAFARSLALKNNRNADWADSVVRNSISATEQEALEEGVIEIIADNPSELLDKLHGRKVSTESGEYLLDTKSCEIERIKLSFKYKLLSMLVNPSLAYILLMLGFYGIYFELSNPGAVFPGVLGGICLLLAFTAFQYLPINYAGIALIGLALILFFLEFKVQSYGALTIGGIIAMLLGSLMMIDSTEQIFQISLRVIIPVVFFSSVLTVIILGLVIKGHKKQVTTGIEGMIGERIELTARMIDNGTLFLRGEYWRFTSSTDLEPGDKVKVISIDNLVLKVELCQSSDSGG